VSFNKDRCEGRAFSGMGKGRLWVILDGREVGGIRAGWSEESAKYEVQGMRVRSTKIKKEERGRGELDPFLPSPKRRAVFWIFFPSSAHLRVLLYILFSALRPSLELSSISDAIPPFEPTSRPVLLLLLAPPPSPSIEEKMTSYRSSSFER